MSETNHIPHIENGLHKLFPAPKDAFLDKLEQKLRTQVVASREVNQNNEGSLWARLRRIVNQHQRAALMLGLTLMSVIVVMVIGPQRVLGAMGGLFDRVYVPGVGFVDADMVRMLPTPVADTRDGVTLRVEQVLAERDRTLVVLSFTGLSNKERNEYVNGSYLLMPDGTPVVAHSLGVEWDKVTFELRSLPMEVLELDFVWEKWSTRRLSPGAWWQDTSGAWVIPFTLEYVGASDGIETHLAYSLSAASDTHRDITVQVLEANQSVDGTALRLKIQWPAKAPFEVFSNMDIELRDESENEYYVEPVHHWNDAFQEEYNTDPPALYSSWQETIIFSPAAMDAHQFTLRVDKVQIEDDVGISFAMDLGPNPQIGDSWPLDVWFEAAGLSIHINSVRLVEKTVYTVVESRKGEERDILALEFALDPLLIEEEDSLDTLSLSSPIELIDVFVSYYDDESSGFSLMHLPIGYDLNSLPSGPFRVNIDYVVLSLHGPWIITWDVPEIEELDN